MTRVLLLVGTPKGAFILESDAERRDWSIRGPFCEGWPIHDVIVEPAAERSSPGAAPVVWGCGLSDRRPRRDVDPLVRRADLRRGDGLRTLPTVWSLATTSDAGVLAGVEPAGLFRSDDRGRTWSHVAGLREHPTTPDVAARRRRPDPAFDRAASRRIPSASGSASRRSGVFETDATAARPGNRATAASAPTSIPTRTRSSVSASTSSAARRRRTRDASTSRTTAASYRTDRRRRDTGPRSRARPAERVRLPAGRPSARPGHDLGDPADATGPGPVHARTRQRPSGARRDRGELVGTARRWPAAGARLPERAARGDGRRPARSGRASTSGPSTRPALAQLRRGRRPGD